MLAMTMRKLNYPAVSFTKADLGLLAKEYAGLEIEVVEENETIHIRLVPTEA